MKVMTSSSKPGRRSRSKVQARPIFPKRLKSAFASKRLLFVCGLFLLYLMLGGSSRPDVLSLVVLRPVAVLATIAGFATLSADQIRAHRFLLGFAAAIVGLTLGHLVPLPPAVWSQLPSHQLVAEIDNVAGLPARWRSLSLAPSLTWNALFALFVPLSILVHAIQLAPEERRCLAWLLLSGAVASSLLAVLQLLGQSNGILYFYDVTNNGAAVGFFANRNHHAIFLASMLPLLAVVAARRGVSRSDDQRRLVISAAIGILLVPLLLVTGSRAGLLGGVIGLVAIPFLYQLASVRRRPDARRRRSLWGSGIGFVGLAVLVAWSLLSGRAESIQRVVDPTADPELRFRVWPAIIENLSNFLPWGSGIGSYEQAFRMIEPVALLRPTYSNHAHNDWLEVLMTAGVPGALLLAMAVGAFFVAMIRLLRRGRGLGAAWNWLGLTMVLIMAIGSAFDYPLRTPALAATFVIACLWGSLGATAEAGGRDA